MFELALQECPESPPIANSKAEPQLTVEFSNTEVDEIFADIIQHIDTQITPEAEEALTQVEMAKKGGSSQVLLMSTWYGRMSAE